MCVLEKRSSTTTVAQHIQTFLAALNATVAVRRVQPRQNQSGEDKEDPTNLVSQVLNPELALNYSGKP